MLSTFLVIAVASMAVAVFGFGLTHVGLQSVGRRSMIACLTGVTTILDAELSDLQKEKAVRASGMALLLSSLEFVGRVSILVIAAAGVIYLADRTSIAEQDQVVACLLRFDFLLAVTLAALLYWRFRRPRPNDRTRSSMIVESSQDQADQLIHTLAFASPTVAKALAKLDGWLAARALNLPSDPRLIFITSLPRAGTTALLNAFDKVPQLAAHQYRDMPFITAPFLWSKLSGARKVRSQARAHGDGLTIDLNSPEAFDEVLWKLYWPNNYHAAKIDPWTDLSMNPKSVRRLKKNYQTISALRATPIHSADRAGIVSKNNANIGRLAFLNSAFPSADIVIPLRQPGPHAASLYRQHLNFLRQQRDDPFTKTYMQDIGHFEFGALHKPIAFPGYADNPYQTCEANYWLFYWLIAFRAVQRDCDGCVFITQDALRAKPDETMRALAQRLDLNVEGLCFGSVFRRSQDICDESVFDPDLLREAKDLYNELAARAVATNHQSVPDRSPK